jgi:hypothetical protein
MLNLKNIKSLLVGIDKNLNEAASLCLIGSAATILLGQPKRTTEDIDAWAKASLFREAALSEAVEKAGLSYDPREEFPKAPYLQIVHPGIVHVPGYEPETRRWFGEEEQVVWRGERLTITIPPPEALIASKLVRGDTRDLEDCLWIMSSKAPEASLIMSALHALPTRVRDSAEENLGILEFMRKP